MANNGKDTNHTGHIDIKVHFIRNGENSTMHNIDWFEEGIQLADIANKNVGENELIPRMKYIMVSLDR